MLLRPVAVYSPEGHYIGHVEGNLRLALRLESDRVMEERLIGMFRGRTREELETVVSDPNHPRNFRWSRRGEDCSWKYNRGPRGRTLCKRTRRKPQYH